MRQPAGCWGSALNKAMEVATHQQLIGEFAQHFLSGQHFRTIVEARQFASQMLGQPVEPSTLLAKAVEEAIEGGLVEASRHIVAGAEGNHLVAYDDLRDLYDRQPNLQVRTSDSIRRQAYSTPLPIAYLAGVLAQAHPSTTVYEPTAGNGALLLLADPRHAIVNEMDATRAAELKAQGFEVTERDATEYVPEQSYHVLMTNPPFGIVQKDGSGPALQWRHGPLVTQHIDHAITLKALDNLRPDGRAVIILGGKMGDEDARRKSYRSQASRGFFKYLYQDSGWKVEDHFSIHGALYRRQGAGFPIDVVVINGKGQTDSKLPGVTPPRQYDTYDQLRDEVLRDASHHYDQRFVGDGAAYGTRPGAPRRPAPHLDPSPVGWDDAGRGRVLVDDRRSPGRTDDSRPRGLPSAAGVAAHPEAATMHLGLADGRSDGGRRYSGDALKNRGRHASGGLGGGDDRGPAEFQRRLPEASGIPRWSGELLPSEAGSDGARNDGVSHNVALHRLDGAVSGGGDGGRRMVSQAKSKALDDDDPLRQDTTLPYVPRSNGPRLEVMAPASAISAYERYFDKIEVDTGRSVDEYVRERLNEPSLETLYGHYAAEQIDTLAQAIYNYEYKQQATVIGHDTGIGKTRIVAGLCRYAQRQGLTPCVVTDNTTLYKDLLYRDGPDTGNQFNAFITDNNLKIPVESRSGERIAEIRTPPQNTNNVKTYTRQGHLGGHNLLLTTYGQLTGLPSRPRRELMEALAPRLFLIADEAHNAGGPSGSFELSSFEERRRQQKQAEGKFIEPVSEFFQAITQKTAGFVASSATAIKDPVVAARLYYHSTDFKDAASNAATFAEHLQVGGAAMQQMAFDLWSASGGCLRFQKDNSGIEFGAKEVDVDLDRAEDNARLIRLIHAFDMERSARMPDLNDELAKSGEKVFSHDQHIGIVGIHSTSFSSVAHNLQALCSLGLKAEATAQLAISDIEAGKKPVIMLYNTAETVLEEFVRDTNEAVDLHNHLHPDPADQLPCMEPGQPIEVTAGEFFHRYLEKARTIRIIDPYEDEKGQQIVPHYLSDEELGEVALARYQAAKAAIERSDWSAQPADPISLMKYRIHQAGHTVEEITGRSQTLDYHQGDGGELVATYQTRQASAGQKVRAIARFQAGATDALITNSTTGYSIHADRRAADQRQRVMYIVQPHTDVNQCEQSIGRIHRSGQANPAIHKPDAHDLQGRPQWGHYSGTFGLPSFKLLYGKGLATEQRPLAVLMRKMRHLKSNTAGTDQSQFSGADVPDFMNAYGDEAAANVLSAWPELNDAMGHPARLNEDGEVRGASIRQVTGRIILLAAQEPPTPENPHPSLALQASVYDALTAEYILIKQQKEALGEWNLGAKRLDLEAKPLRRKLLKAGDGANPFRQPVYALEVDAKTGRKPLTTLQVVQQVHRSLGLESPPEREGIDVSYESTFRQAGRSHADERIQLLDTEYEQYRQAKLPQLQAAVDKAKGRLATLEATQEALLERKRELERRSELIIPEFDTQKKALEDAGTLDAHAEAELVQRYEAERKETTQQLEMLERDAARMQNRIDHQSDRMETAKQSLEQTSCRLQAQCHGVKGRLREFPIGQSVSMAGKKSDSVFTVPGVVVDVLRTQNASNPVHPSCWRLKLQLASEAREVIVKFSDISRGIALKPQEDALVVKPTTDEASMMARYEMAPTYEVFDAKQKATREIRYMVVGQVLATDLTGTFAQMQDDQGAYHPAYLLPKTVDDKAIDERPVGLDCPEQVQAFLEATDRTAKLSDRSGKLTLEFTVQRDMIVCAPTGKEGKRFYQDTAILEAAAGEQFVSGKTSLMDAKKSVMRLVVKDPAVQDAVLAAIQRRHGLKALTRLDDAQSVIGATQANWEPTTTWLPQDSTTQATQMQRVLHPLLKAAMSQNPDLIPESENEGGSSRQDIIRAVSERLYQGADLQTLKEEFQLNERPESALTFHTLIHEGVLVTDGQPVHPQVIEYLESLHELPIDDIVDKTVSGRQGLASSADRLQGLGRVLRQLSDLVAQGQSMQEARKEVDQVLDAPWLELFSAEQVRQMNDGLKGVGHQETDAVLAAQEEPEDSRTTAERAEVLRQILRDANQKQLDQGGPHIKIPTQQSGPIAENVARLLHQADLQHAVMDGDNFHFKVENEPFKPLVIEAHDIGGGDRKLYLTHYNQENGDTWIDAELVMKLEATGSLHFVETASYDPYTCGESRLLDAAFGELFSSNLVTQGFGAAAAKAQAAHREAESQAARRAAAQADETSQEKTEAMLAVLPETPAPAPAPKVGLPVEEGPSGQHPALRQFAEVKAQHPNAISFINTGDRYETYGEDAEAYAQLTGASILTLEWERDPDCAGVQQSPQALGQGIERATQQGFTVVVADVDAQIRIYEGQRPAPLPEFTVLRQIDETFVGIDSNGMAKVGIGAMAAIACQHPDFVKGVKMAAQIQDPDLFEEAAAVLMNTDLSEADRREYVETIFASISAPTLDHSLELSHEGPGSVQDLVAQADDIGCKPMYDESSTDSEPQGGQEVSSLGQPSGSHPDRLTSTLQDLRVWYREARALGRSPDHLKKIESVGTTVAAGDLTAFGPRDKQMRQVDQDQFQQQVSNVAVQARFLLARLGSPAQEGATRFQGKTYGLLTKDDRLTVTAEGRGIILDVHGDEVRLSKVEKGDANRFTKFVQTVQQDLPTLQTISARRPTGYER